MEFFKLIAMVFWFELSLSLKMFYWICVPIYRGLHGLGIRFLGKRGMCIFYICAIVEIGIFIKCLERFGGADATYNFARTTAGAIFSSVLFVYITGAVLSHLNPPVLFQSSVPVKKSDGLAYEHRVAKALSAKGFRSATVTPGSGDFGADVIASKGFDKYAIQCKYYSGTVGVSAVQEAIAGKAYYKCSKAMVVTNSTFTPAAKKLAKSANVVLLEHFSPGGSDWIDQMEEVDAILED